MNEGRYLSLFVLFALILLSCGRGSGPQLNYRVIAVTNGGSIDGAVTFDGVKPAADPIIVQKDQDVCGESHPNPTNPGNGLGIAGAIVYLDTITAGKDWSGIDTVSKIDQHGCEFHPHTQIVRAGATITISNSDKVLHNFHVFVNSKPVVNAAQPEGAPPREINLDDIGLHIVNCDVHPWMRGFVMTTGHPYFAMTDASGHYSLTNIPPGTYTVKVWRDSWVIDQPKGPNGNVSGYDWHGDFHDQRSVEVKSGAATTADFKLH